MTRTFPFPNQPVLEWGAFGTGRTAAPSLLDLPNRVFTQSGRSAISLALELLGVAPGECVLVPTYHCPTMIAPIERMGALPHFYPLRDTREPNLEHLAAACPPRTRAMLVAHLFGEPIDMTAVKAFCRDRGIALIEDCAHCFIGAGGGAAVGTTGDFAIGSLPKFFPVLQGGILAWSADRWAAKLPPPRSIRPELRAAWDALHASASAGRLGTTGRLVRCAAALRDVARLARRSPQLRSSEEPSPTEIRRAGLADPLLEPLRIRRTDEWIVAHSDLEPACRRRRENFDALASGLTGLSGARPLYGACGTHSAPYVLPLLIAEPDRAYAQMRALRLPVFRWDRIWPDTPLITGDAAVAWSRGIVQVACHQSLTLSDIAKVARDIRQCVGGY